jgi:hypothetical protein
MAARSGSIKGILNFWALFLAMVISFSDCLVIETAFERVRRLLRCRMRIRT